MADSQNIHILHKNLGETPHEAILGFKKDHPEYTEIPMTYAGRLDPMAEGVLIVLSGDGVMEKDTYLDLPKTYEFEVLWGYETDTLDLLGLVTSLGNKVPSVEEVKDYLQKNIGVSEQVYPIYSSRPVNGKSLFQWAREGRISEIDIPTHDVEMFEGAYLDRRTISKDDLLKNIEYKVGLVRGDFRQEEILKKWRQVLGNTTETEFSIDRIRVVVSSGFYIRQFVFDLAQNFGTTATTFHIKRTAVGKLVLG